MKKVISMFLATLTLLSCFVVINVSAATGQDIVNEAKKWIGTKYGHSDGSGGPGTLVDCSGLVLQVYKKYGYNLTWSTSSQSKAGTQVNKSSLQLGDIVCFSNSTGSISHVGIYVGNDQMIHAPGDGKTVQYGSSISKWTLSQAKCKLEYGRRLIADPPSSTPTPAPSEQPSRPSSKPSPIGDVNTVLRWKELNKTYNKTTEQLQACLNYIMNAGLTVDGIYGIKTHDAVKAFQQKYGLKVDGDAGPQTLKKVNEVLATMGGGHTHNFSGTWHEAVHPHREYKKCNGCGETELTGKTVSDANCAQCTTPGKPVLLSMKKQYYADSEITFTWDPTENTTHYNLYVHKRDKNGEYKTLENNFYVESGMSLSLPVGEYKVFLQPTNSKAWTDDKSTWRYTNSDMYYFEVIERHVHSYTTKYENEHPHEEYNECDCGDIQYTGDTKKLRSCEECYPHKHDYGTYYEDAHPHEKYLECDCGDVQYTGDTKKVRSCKTCYPVVKKKNIKLQIGIPYMDVDGKEQEIDPGRGTTPVIRNERTLLPIRLVMESFGAYVLWDETENRVTIDAGNTIMHFWIGSQKAVVNDEICMMDVAPVIINERTFMPLRFIAENIGLEVGWNAANQTVTVEGEIA